MSYLLENNESNDYNNSLVKKRKYQCKFDSKISNTNPEDKNHHDSKKMGSLKIKIMK